MRTLIARVCVVGLLLLITSHIALAQGQNIFFVPPTFPGSQQTVTADFNRDGKPDLINADGTVLLGNGDGTFTTGTALSVPGGGRFIATGDFNGDGKPDVALTAFSTILYIFLGNGDGTFQAPLTANFGFQLGSIVAADVNSDGKPDLVGVGFVLLGNGDGTFRLGTMYPGSGQLAIGDFNGDGKPDIALASSSSVQVLLGNGDGTFQTAITSTGVNSPIAIVAKDFNDDGVLDLAISDRTTQKTFILLGNGNGTFSPPGSPLPAAGALAAADLNADGKPDLVVQQEPFVTVFLGSGNGTFTLKDTYYSRLLFLLGSDRVLVADFNGDGKLDVAANNAMFLGNGDGSLRGNAAIPLTGPGVGGSLGTVTGDFNGDGSADLAIGSDPNLYIILNDGSGKLSLAHTYTLPVPFDGIATADLRGTGKLDLVIITHNLVTRTLIVNVMLGNGDGTFGPPAAFPNGVTANVVGLAFADFNGDHKPDLAIIGDQLNVFLGNGDGTFGAPASFFAGGGGPTSFVTGDFNNDGIVDVVFGSGAGLGILLGKGDGTFQPATFLNQGGPRVYASADLNGDGKADLIADGAVLLGNGNGTFRALPPTNCASTNVVDVAGDGKLDLISAFQGVNLCLGNGDGTFRNPIVILPRGAGPVFVLTNQGRRPDLAVYAEAAFLGGNGRDGGVFTVLNTGQHAVADFSLSANSTATMTVSAGETATYTVFVTPVDGFNQSVAFSCSGLPAGATCTVSPNPVSLNGTSSALETVTITTKAPSQGFAPPFGTGVRVNSRLRSFLLGLLGIVVIVSLLVWHRNRQRPWAGMVTLAVLLFAGMTILSCGAGAGSSQPGTYTITVSGSSTSGSTTLMHNINLTLIVH